MFMNYCKISPVHIVLEQAADIMVLVFKVPTFCCFSDSYFYEKKKQKQKQKQ